MFWPPLASLKEPRQCVIVQAEQWKPLMECEPQTRPPPQACQAGQKRQSHPWPRRCWESSTSHLGESNGAGVSKVSTVYSKRDLGFHFWLFKQIEFGLSLSLDKNKPGREARLQARMFVILKRFPGYVGWRGARSFCRLPKELQQYVETT